MATHAERRLTAQVARAESTLRDVRGELEERTRLLARTKKTIDSLQRDLQRARDSESSSRELARERHDADTRRVAELERQLAETKGDETHADVSRRALVDRLASLERALEDRELERVRLEGELARREAAAETHREDAARAARTIEQQRLAIEEARETLEANRARSATPPPSAPSAPRRCVCSWRPRRSCARPSARCARRTGRSRRRCGARRRSTRRRWLRFRELIWRRRARDDSATTLAGAPPDALASRLAKLQTDMKALAEREIRVLARQTAMTEEMDALRGALESERAGRVAAEARARAAEARRDVREAGDGGDAPRRQRSRRGTLV